MGGDLFVNRALGAVVHLSTIGGSVQQIGGGGGRTCTPSGIFAQFKSPVYSDYEDNAIGAELLVTNVQSCWFGALRNHVGHSIVAVSNKMADPDAMEVNSNRIARRIACFGNSPAVQFGGSSRDAEPRPRSRVRPVWIRRAQAEPGTERSAPAHLSARLGRATGARTSTRVLPQWQPPVSCAGGGYGRWIFPAGVPALRTPPGRSTRC